LSDSRGLQRGEQAGQPGLPSSRQPVSSMGQGVVDEGQAEQKAGDRWPPERKCATVVIIKKKIYDYQFVFKWYKKNNQLCTPWFYHYYFHFNFMRRRH